VEKDGLNSFPCSYKLRLTANNHPGRTFEWLQDFFLNLGYRERRKIYRNNEMPHRLRLQQQWLD